MNEKKHEKHGKTNTHSEHGHRDYNRSSNYSGSKGSKKSSGMCILTGAVIVLAILVLAITFQLNTVNTNLQSISNKLDNLAGSAILKPTGAAAVDTTAKAAAPSAPTAPTAQKAPSAAAAANNDGQPVNDVAELMKGLADDDAVKGNPDAPVTIVEWSDYQCPYCGRFYSQTLGQIDDQYIKTGKVKLVYRDFPLNFHQNAQKAAEAAECAGEQGKYYEMHNKLFETNSLSVENYKKFAGELGLNQAEFDSCLDSGKMASEIAADLAAGQAAGIRGTPGFVINGKLVSGAQPFSVFKAAIDDALNN